MAKFVLPSLTGQQQISRDTVTRLRAERAGVTDPEHAAALDGQIRLHSELAGIKVPAEPEPAKPGT